MSLRERLIRDIVESGPISVADYMMRCLHDAEDGYYATRPRLGPEGDFITAPLVSQMFGELIGLWAVQAWLDAGAPASFRLVEAGPGDGTLMSDLLRVARLRPDFLAAADLWLVETSEPLRREQHLRLGANSSLGNPKAPKWAASLAEVPGGAPLLLVCNELLDCLPVRQFVRTPSGWAERMVGVDAAGALAFGLAPRPELQGPPNAPEGLIIERSPAQEAFGAALGARIAADGGAALLIDYGRDAPGPGDTLQALRAHQKEHPLAHPGGADLTAHADFPAVLAAARAAGAGAAPILTQGDFLTRLGLVQRAEALAAKAPERADLIARQVERLADPAQMGVLFKAACIHAPDWPPPAFALETA